MNDAILNQYMFSRSPIKKYVDREKMAEDFMCKLYIEENFNFIRMEGIDEVNRRQNVICGKILATDGAALNIKEVLVKLKDEEYVLFIKYHFAAYERTVFILVASHVIDILKKKKWKKKK